MKKFFNILLRICCLRKARQKTTPAFNNDQAEILCANADEIMSYILHGTPYIPEWRIKKEFEDSE